MDECEREHDRRLRVKREQGLRRQIRRDALLRRQARPMTVRDWRAKLAQWMARP